MSIASRIPGLKQTHTKDLNELKIGLLEQFKVEVFKPQIRTVRAGRSLFSQVKFFFLKSQEKQENLKEVEMIPLYILYILLSPCNSKARLLSFLTAVVVAAALCS